jgi:hypothetical protein
MCIIGICLWYDLGRILLDKQNANNCKCFKSNVICISRCHGKAHNVKCLNQNWNKDIIQTAFLDLVALDFIILVLFTRSCFKFLHSAIKLFFFLAALFFYLWFILFSLLLFWLPLLSSFWNWLLLLWSFLFLSFLLTVMRTIARVQCHLQFKVPWKGTQCQVLEP